MANELVKERHRQAADPTPMAWVRISLSLIGLFAFLACPRHEEHLKS